jgi:hypothetical protein
MKIETRKAISFILMLFSISIASQHIKQLGYYKYNIIIVISFIIFSIINLNRLKSGKHRIYVLVLNALSLSFCFWYNYLSRVIFYIILLVLIILSVLPFIILVHRESKV